MRPLAITAGTAISAMGRGVEATIAALRSRRSGLVPCDFGGYEAGHIGRVAGVERHALPEALSRYDCRNNRLADMALHTDGFAEAVAAARAHYGADRVGTVLGTSTSGILSGEEAYRARDPGTGRLPGSFDHEHTQDLFSLARYVRTALALRGPAFVVSTACASASKSFIDAQHLIEAGICDAVVVGGADSLCRMTMRGFAALELISPTPCRPCDESRSGISVGEAVGFALLERPGARPHGPDAGIRATLLGHGASSDGHHMSSPHPEGHGAILAMRQALDRAGLAPAAIDYLNLHGTGTRANDAMEDIAVAAVFGDATACSSTKGWSGHTLGASGILETVIAAIAITHGLRPGCLGVDRLDPQFRARVLVANEDAPTARVMSNSFGFGGINCSLLFGQAA